MSKNNKKKRNKNKRVAVYARFSSDNQSNNSITAQLKILEKYCKDKDYTIVKEYIDRAKSATNDKRQGFQDMISDSAKDLYDVICVHKFDRFARNAYQSAKYKGILKKRGITVESVCEQFEDNPAGRMMERNMESWAEYYSDNLSSETMKGHMINAYKFLHNGGKPPLGFDIDSQGYLTINEYEAEAVKLIFNMISDGHSYGMVIEELNKAGFKTKTNRQFGKNSLYNILKNEKYMGIYVYNKSASKDFEGRRNTHSYKDNSEIIRIPDGCPRIISAKVFNKVQEIMRTRKLGSGMLKAKENYLLSGLIVCGVCGKKMCGNTRHSGNKSRSKYSSYECPDHRFGCDNKALNRTHIEDFILSYLKLNLFEFMDYETISIMVNDLIKEHDKMSNGTLSAIKGKLKKISSSKDNLISALETGTDVDLINKRLKALNQEENELNKTIKELEKNYVNQFPITTSKDIAKLEKKVYEFIKNNKLPVCKSFVNSFVEQVIVYPDRVDITLRAKHIKTHKLARYYELLGEAISSDNNMSKAGKRMITTNFINFFEATIKILATKLIMNGLKINCNNYEAIINKSDEFDLVSSEKWLKALKCYRMIRLGIGKTKNVSKDYRFVIPNIVKGYENYFKEFVDENLK